VYDPFSAESHEDPYPAYRVLREELPAYYNEERAFWALSRYADVGAALRDWRTFSSAAGVERGGDLMDMDPPRHDAVRRVIAPRFRGARVAELEEDVRALARALVAGFDASAPVDLARDFAARLPVLTICRILGVPGTDAPAAGDLALALVARSGSGPDTRARALVARSALVDLFIGLVEERRRGAPAAGLIGDLAQALDAGEIASEDVAGLCLMLVVAGMEPTSSLLANMLHALATARVRAGDLRARDGRVRAEAVSEFLRHDSPVQWLSRVTTRAVPLHASLIPAGQRVLLLLGSANRDPREFSDPDTLDLRRPARANLAFGAGAHACLGMALARLETRVAIEVLLDRFPSPRLAGSAVRSASHVVRGFEALPAALAGERG
jgi:cytochrome P450